MWINGVYMGISFICYTTKAAIFQIIELLYGVILVTLYQICQSEHTNHTLVTAPAHTAFVHASPPKLDAL